jgi:ubiquinol-cytochrome c reductase subunit 9
MSSFTKTIYNLLFRRSATIALTTVVGVFAYERIINKSAEYIYERRNQGKLWKHVQPQFKLKTDEDEDEAAGSSQDNGES